MMSLTDEYIVSRIGAFLSSFLKNELIGVLIINEPINPIHTIIKKIKIMPIPGKTTGISFIILGIKVGIIASILLNAQIANAPVTANGTVYNKPLKKYFTIFFITLR